MRNTLTSSNNNNLKFYCPCIKKKRKPVQINVESVNSTSKSLSKYNLPMETEYYQVHRAPIIQPLWSREGLCIVLEGDTVCSSTQVSKHEQFSQIDSKCESFNQCSENFKPSPICTVNLGDFSKSQFLPTPSGKTLSILRHVNSFKKSSNSSVSLDDDESRSQCIFCILNDLRSLPPCCSERAIKSFLKHSSDCSVNSSCHKHRPL